MINALGGPIIAKLLEAVVEFIVTGIRKLVGEIVPIFFNILPLPLSNEKEEVIISISLVLAAALLVVWRIRISSRDKSGS